MGNEQGTPVCDWDSTPDALWPNWMADISDSKSVAELSIPGTHNTMAFYGGALVECQRWPLSQQYKAGIRFVDIRCRHIENNLTIHHDVVYQQAVLGDVFRDTIAFLKENTGEVILMRIKEDHDETCCTRSFDETLKNKIEAYGESHFWVKNQVPTLGEARGKIVIIQNYPCASVGINYWSLDIADDYHVPTIFHTPQKWSGVKDHLEKARYGHRSQIFLTFASGSSGGAYPNAVADRVNPELYYYLNGFGDQTIRWGIIVMDFPASILVHKIIQSNK
ncbi:1-phosphatidylinositol phosphodiesterase-like [Lepisosteus oculatus]|uniref:1-phosphatidylinositol phosphodiesterase-like n=1 Tax=Lepisosteus oculatus TaxID=7918 RepID=UPI0035F508DB